MNQVNERCWRSNVYNRKGIDQVELHISFITCKTGKMTIKKYFILLRCNANQLLGNNKYCITNLNTYTPDMIIKALNNRLIEMKELRNISINTANIREWLTDRADLAIDVKSPFPSIHIWLCNHGVPYRYESMKRKKINKTKEVLYKESCCFENGSKEINIYDKEVALINKSDVDHRQVNKMKGVIRVEFQIKRQGIKNNAKGLQSKRSIAPYLDKNYVYGFISHKIEGIFGKEKYVNTSTAIKIIDNSTFSNDEKVKMKETLYLIHQKGGLYELEESLYHNDQILEQKIGSLNTFKRTRLKNIRSLGINPVTIPDDFGITELPSLLELIYKKIAE